jgi:hypothetical protein
MGPYDLRTHLPYSIKFLDPSASAQVVEYVHQVRWGFGAEAGSVRAPILNYGHCNELLRSRFGNFHCGERLFALWSKMPIDFLPRGVILSG